MIRPAQETKQLKVYPSAPRMWSPAQAILEQKTLLSTLFFPPNCVAGVLNSKCQCTSEKQELAWITSPAVMGLCPAKLLLPRARWQPPLVKSNYFPSPLPESVLFHVMTQHKGSLCRA